jgi:hypothetical protein
MRTTADSASWLGGIVLALISNSSLSRQLSFVVTGSPAPSKSSSTGSCNAPSTACAVSDGPIARRITFFGSVPVMMMPPIKTFSPVCTLSRVEMFSSCSGATVGVGVADGDGLAVALGKGVAVGVTVAVGSGEIVGTGVGEAVGVGVGSRSSTVVVSNTAIISPRDARSAADLSAAAERC